MSRSAIGYSKTVRKRRDGSCEIGYSVLPEFGGFGYPTDNDEDVVHPLNRHILPLLVSLLMPVLVARGARRHAARKSSSMSRAGGAASI
jgi:hypothetical protein